MGAVKHAALDRAEIKSLLCRSEFWEYWLVALKHMDRSLVLYSLCRLSSYSKH